ncbi:uncharacterized protein ALTATR162_LOCUS1550 [Alternaria atra]|uniref:glucan 1,3-beta-glucosidase n=1 Tax=Alternaria atra TaxID=119953 RepID=A0A8J2HVU5_9PLEO|nr:uncharacterized protein ALTATR162_LOCUS1550 [Alternaria atra]CAG5144458.1 unnamed protein product [Alternaria atra]
MRVSAALTTVLLSSLGIHLHTDGANHGATVPFHDKCPFSIPAVDLSPIRHSHDITWGKGVNGGNFINRKTFKANGANLGGWLEKEQTHGPSLNKCASVFEERYASFINTTTIDELANVGVNTLRIPLTYAAFIEIPGSQLHHGNQLKLLKTITDYATNKYNMHVIFGLHSLPGGVNNLDIGEALFHQDWFQNSTNLDHSFQAVDGVLNFIKNSGHINAFTIAPINEASDDFAGFGSAAGLTTKGTDWINTHFDGVLKKIAKNIVFDSHIYYFAAAGTYTGYVNPAVCGKAQYITQETKFSVFVGEWSLQAIYNNTLNTRKTIFDAQRYAWNKYLAGGSFWNGVSYATAKVDGDGTQREYWSYIDLIHQGFITKITKKSYC